MQIVQETLFKKNKTKQKEPTHKKGCRVAQEVGVSTNQGCELKTSIIKKNLPTSQHIQQAINEQYRICVWEAESAHTKERSITQNGFKNGNLFWPSVSFLTYWDISEAARLLPKSSISPSSDRDEEHGGMEENKNRTG
jgi:hypothetical protein